MTGSKFEGVDAEQISGEQQRLLIETWVRGIALLLVVVAIVAYPMYGLIFHTEPATLAQYIAPITGIAGAIVGYWFGQASRHTDPRDRKEIGVGQSGGA